MALVYYSSPVVLTDLENVRIEVVSDKIFWGMGAGVRGRCYFVFKVDLDCVYVHKYFEIR
jgi:hypothetical protein